MARSLWVGSSGASKGCRLCFALLAFAVGPLERHPSAAPPFWVALVVSPFRPPAAALFLTFARFHRFSWSFVRGPPTAGLAEARGASRGHDGALAVHPLSAAHAEPPGAVERWPCLAPSCLSVATAFALRALCSGATSEAPDIVRDLAWRAVGGGGCCSPLCRPLFPLACSGISGKWCRLSGPALLRRAPFGSPALGWGWEGCGRPGRPAPAARGCFRARRMRSQGESVIPATHLRAHVTCAPRRGSPRRAGRGHRQVRDEESSRRRPR